ncbi:MAG: hypothetical protein IJL63_00480 [Clostridia bacterium]|nr:hypothetical protein [Clostridia bacterium]
MSQIDIQKIIEERKRIPAYDEQSAEDKCQELLAALGDDENEVYEFIKSADDDMFIYLTEIYEEIIEKFESDRIDNLFVNRE